jgi:thiol-disulfide isomerase/thioredoxin
LPFRILHFQDSLISLPDAACRLLGIVTGFAFYCIHRRLLRWVIPGVTLAMCLFMSFGGYMMWIDELNYGDIGAVTAEHSAMRFIDEQRDTLSVTAWEGKIVVLDFWTTSCGVCFRKFPQVQRFYDKYKDNSRVALYAVNDPLERDNKDQLFNLLREKGYTFPVLLAYDSTSSYMKVRSYPAVLVLDTVGNVAYRGSIEVAEKKVEKMLKAYQK